MPRSDNTEADTDYKEQQRKAEQEQRKKARKTMYVTNKLLRKQLSCKCLCCYCETKCNELQEWIDQEDKSK